VTPRDLKIEPPTRQNLAQHVARQLLAAIQSGILAPGDRLPSETELQQRFRVGRSTIREALNGLVLLGAIEVRHGQGAIVIGHGGSAGNGLQQAVQRAVTAELLEAREVTETAIARLAAERATDDDLTELGKLLDRHERRLRDEGAAIEEAARFHLLLAEAAQNEIFSEFIQMLLGLFRERGELLREGTGYAEWELEAHRDVLEAVRSGSGERAQRAMARHLQDMRVILLQGWDVFRLRSGHRLG
jgi:GntR family transcriptional regulator, transcriptional repressor for pyruvate dehydrogenase complex